MINYDYDDVSAIKYYLSKEDCLDIALTEIFSLLLGHSFSALYPDCQPNGCETCPRSKTHPKYYSEVKDNV